MQQHNRSRSQVLRDPPANLLRAGPRTVEHAECPTEDCVAELARHRREKRTAIAVRRAKDARGLPRRPFDDSVRDVQLLADAAWPDEMQLDVALSMVTDLMPLVGNTAGYRRITADVIAHHEERGRHPLTRQRAENRGSRVPVGTVVEGEIDLAGRTRAVADDRPKQAAIRIVHAKCGQPCGRSGTRRSDRAPSPPDHVVTRR